MIWMAVVAVDGDRGGGGDSGDGEHRERWKMAEKAQMMKEMVDNGNR
jgi:hypothetical protein